MMAVDFSNFLYNLCFCTIQSLLIKERHNNLQICRVWPRRLALSSIMSVIKSFRSFRSTQIVKQRAEMQ